MLLQVLEGGFFVLLSSIALFIYTIVCGLCIHYLLGIWVLHSWILRIKLL